MSSNSSRPKMAVFSHLMLQFSILVLVITLSYGCISSGDEDIETRHVLQLKRKNADVVLNEHFIETYLKTFGYLRDPPNVKELHNKGMKKTQLETALKSFQEFMGIPSKGIVDGRTSQSMMRKRCANKDHFASSFEINSIWQKSVLTFNLSNMPTTLKKNEFRELLHQAFAAWEIVIPMDFVEVHDVNKADIVFAFKDPSNNWDRDPTHLGIAGATGPLQSKIWLSIDEDWDTNNNLDQTKIDLFNVLVHEIGHVLGLRHSADTKSMMHPLFERNVDQERPEVTSDDVERLRNLYQVIDIDTGLTAKHIEKNTKHSGIIGGVSKKCPLTLQSITQAPNGDYIIFKDSKVWRSVNTTLVSEAVPVYEVFPSGPDYVNTSATVGELTVLVSDRELFVYTQDRKGRFGLSPEYPKPLHERVLFYPEAAFPLSNGSLILLSDNVFATYDLEQNAPTFLHDKTIYFPNLPDELRGGIPETPGSDSSYEMFTSDMVYKYDMRIQQVIGSQPLATYFTCDL